MTDADPLAHSILEGLRSKLVGRTVVVSSPGCAYHKAWCFLACVRWSETSVWSELCFEQLDSDGRVSTHEWSVRALSCLLRDGEILYGRDGRQWCFTLV